LSSKQLGTIDEHVALMEDTAWTSKAIQLKSLEELGLINK
jgi:hypothetical protein